MKTKSQDTLFNYILSNITAKVVGLAVALGIDTKLSTKPIAIKTLAAKCSYPEVTFYRFLRALESLHIVKLVGKTKVKAGRLCKDLNLIRTPHFLLSYNYMQNLPYALQNDCECFTKTFGKPMYPFFIANPPMLADFKTWCTKTAVQWLPELFQLFDFAKYSTIVDLGGGEGYLLGKILQKNKKLNGILFDQAAITKSAPGVLANYGVTNRVEIISGDFFEAIPKTGDLYILSRVLVNWSNHDCKKILGTCYKHMPKDATLLIIDFFIPKKSDPHYQRTTLSDLNILALSNSKLRNKTEWLELLNNTNYKIKKFYQNDQIESRRSFLPFFCLELTK